MGVRRQIVPDRASLLRARLDVLLWTVQRGGLQQKPRIDNNPAEAQCSQTKRSRMEAEPEAIQRI